MSLMWLVALVLCAGCDRVFQLERHADAAEPRRIEFVQVASANPDGGPFSVVEAPLAQSAGNTVVVAVGWVDPISPINGVTTRVTDRVGSAYRLAAQPLRQAGLNQAIFYAENVDGDAAGKITVTFSDSVRSPDIRVAEYAGVAQNGLHTAVGGTGNSDTPSSGSLATDTPGELLVAAAYVGKRTTAGTPGFAVRVITDPSANLLEDLITDQPATFSATSQQTADNWVMQMAGFRPAR